MKSILFNWKILYSLVFNLTNKSVKFTNLINKKWNLMQQKYLWKIILLKIKLLKKKRAHKKSIKK